MPVVRPVRVATTHAVLAGRAEPATTITYNNPFVTSRGPTSFQTLAYVDADGPGTARIELADPGDSGATQEAHVDSTTASHAGHWTFGGTFDQFPRPGRLYRMRSCFTAQTASAAVCGAWVEARAASVAHNVATGAATYVG